MDPTLKSHVISKLKQQVAGLSPRMKLVAKYVLDNPADFGLDSIRETARKSGVSTFTLVRMAGKFGFDSYGDFREPFRHALVSSAEFVERPAWIDELHETGETGRIQAEAALNTLSVVQRSLDRQTPETLEQVVDALLSARTVYLTAVRASYSMAYYFHYVGRMALTSLQLIPQAMNSAIDDLNYAQEEDVMIAITVTPYSRETIEACKFAQGRGVRLVLITDSDVVAPELKPDFVLVVSTISSHHFACYSGITALLEAILSLLMRRGGQDTSDRIESYERLRAEHNAYWVLKGRRRVFEGKKS